MKKILSLLISIVSVICSYAQADTNEYPKFYIVDGDTIGIIITIDQAQRIDNDLEIKNLLELAITNSDSIHSQYIVVISQLEKRIVILEIKGSELISATNTQRQIINELKSKISIYEQDKKLSDDQHKKKDEIISNQKKTINKLKFTGSSSTGILLVIIGLLIL